jgi:hypothetical protein
VSRSPLLIACAAALAAGSALWLVASLGGGGREPWDRTSYWSFYYPAAIGLSGLLGFGFPGRAWLPALVLMFSQSLIMVAGGSDHGLLPLAIGLLAALSLPAVGAAMLGALLRRRLAS